MAERERLTIAANLAAVPGVAAAWRRGARVMLPAASVQTESGVLQMAFVGQIVAEGAQGVLITVDGYEKLQATLDDTSLSAPERSRRLLTLLANLTLTSALLGLSIRGNVSELRGLDNALARGVDPLADPDATVDLTKPDRSRGDTKDGDHEIEIDVDPPSKLPPVVDAELPRNDAGLACCRVVACHAQRLAAFAGLPELFGELNQLFDDLGSFDRATLIPEHGLPASRRTTAPGPGCARSAF